MTPRPSRPPASIYVAGLFAMGYTEFYIFLIPLYALSLGMSAGEVGLLVGGRSMLGVAWGGVLTMALLRAPEAEIAEADGPSARRPANFRARDVIPRFPDYLRCFALLAIPAVATTMAIIFLRTATNGVQSSLYIVYLNGVGLTGTSIGVLFAAIEVSSGLGALFAGRAMRLGDPQRTMLTGTVMSIVLISATPFLGGIFVLLFLAQAARGWLQGIVQPVMFSVQAKAVGRYRQGSVVGLRQTMNRLAAIVIPPTMGMIADRWGAGESFVILGALMLLLSVPVAVITRRSAATQDAAPRLAD